MLAREAVKSRISSSEGMSLAEFSYQMFQAYDWLHLYNQYRCTVQIGESATIVIVRFLSREFRYREERLEIAAI